MKFIPLPFELKFSKDNKSFRLRATDDSFDYSNSVKDEMIALLEFRFLALRRRKYYLSKIVDEINKASEDDLSKKISEFYSLAFEAAEGFSEHLPALEKLLYAFVIERKRRPCLQKRNLQFDLNEVQKQIDSIFPMQLQFKRILSELAELQMKCENRNQLPTLESIAEFDAKIKIKYENGNSDICYLIESVEDYIRLIFYAYILSKPNLSICQYCGRLFIPKTKKVTLYCDRATPDGSTCKIVGARSKHKSIIDSDPVLKKFYSEKHRIEMYCSRSKIDDYDYIDDYYDWLSKFEHKIDEYKNNQYDGEQLIKEIENETPNFQAYSKGRNFAEEEGY